MSLDGVFSPAAAQPSRHPATKPPRPAPFSLRLSDAERARLVTEAAGAPLGAYIKAKVLGSAPPVRMRRTGLAIADRKALAQLVAIFGRSRLFSNLNQLAHAANCGALPATQETEAELVAALRDLQDIRRLLLIALGLKPDDGGRIAP